MRPEQEVADVDTRHSHLTGLGTTIWQSRFGFQIPATEKILRTLGGLSRPGHHHASGRQTTAGPAQLLRPHRHAAVEQSGAERRDRVGPSRSSSPARQRTRPTASCVRPSSTSRPISTSGSQSSSGVTLGRLAEMVSPDDWPRSRRRTHGPTYSRAHCAFARAASAREIGGAGGRGMAQPASSALNPNALKAFSATRR